ncbi:hypothetical protein ACFPYN_05535 [Paenisporosarcina macmurdoensis]|uniref:EAL domain-containing protein n=1 Tax=Paenisporosarcina macmurdoensis TaxID=212659 RepID=A0ABW1L5H0_9BACL
MEEQVAFLKEFDVVGQGYFFSRPLPAEQLDSWTVGQLRKK